MEVKSTKKNLEPKCEPKGEKLGSKLDFYNFFKFGSLFFLEIAYGDSLQQCIIPTRGKRGKTYEKQFCGPNFGQNQV